MNILSQFNMDTALINVCGQFDSAWESQISIHIRMIPTVDPIKENIRYALECYDNGFMRDERCDLRGASDFYKKASIAFSGISEQLRLLAEQINKDIDDLKQHCYDLV